MSHILVNAYLAEIDRLKKVSGKTTEQVVREAFKDPLKAWSKSAGLIFVAELEHETGLRSKAYPDGTVLHELRVPLGFDDLSGHALPGRRLPAIAGRGM